MNELLMLEAALRIRTRLRTQIHRADRRARLTRMLIPRERHEARAKALRMADRLLTRELIKDGSVYPSNPTGATA